MTANEREYVRLVKLCPCSVCDAGGGEGAPSEAHEVKQGVWWLAIALCADCHRGSRNGLHGQRCMWRLKKLEEVDALAVTIRRVHEQVARCVGIGKLIRS